MILVADSGSTKTAWGIAGGDRVILLQGLNPHFVSDDEVLNQCAEVLTAFGMVGTSPSVRFYGSGCGSEEQRRRMQALLQRGLSSTDVEVHTDMLGACRASCGNKSGYVAILGTGSNCCLYNGTSIVRQPASAGFILGDHGSANHIGRLLLRDYLAGTMPQPLHDAFAEWLSLPYDSIMQQVYHNPKANRFLASMAPFAVERQSDPYISLLLDESLAEWYRYQLHPLLDGRHKPLFLVGGLACALRDKIETLVQRQVSVGGVVKSPIEPLMHHHAARQ